MELTSTCRYPEVTYSEEEQLKEALSMYEKILVKEYSLLMRNKFGFAVKDEGDNAIINNFLELLYTHKKDYHQSIRLLSNDDQSSLGKAFESWFKDYHKRLKIETEDPNQRCTFDESGKSKIYSKKLFS